MERRGSIISGKQEPVHPQNVDDCFHILNSWNISLVIYWQKFFEMVCSIPGDIVECGVGRGRSLLIMSVINQLIPHATNGPRSIVGFDSFEGFPEPTAEDQSYRECKKGEWARSPSGTYEYEPEFIDFVLKQASASRDNIQLKKGYFSDTLPNYECEKIAILHIDGDLYQSYLDVLTNLYDKVASGGLIVFDDFQVKEEEPDRWPGARRAVREFFSDKDVTLRESMRGTPYIVKCG